MVRGARFSQKRVHPVVIPPLPPLLRLPAELRTRIYELVLVSSQQIRPPVDKLFVAARKAERKKNSPYKEPETVLSLARVCKQLHNEILPVYYGKNSFVFDDTYDLYKYLHMIGPDRRALMQQMTFVYAGECRRYAFELLGECASLRQLEILITRDTTKGCRYPQICLFSTKGLMDLEKALGRLPTNLKLNIKEAGEEYLREMCYRRFGPDSLVMRFIYRPHFGRGQIAQLHGWLRECREARIANSQT